VKSRQLVAAKIPVVDECCQCTKHIGTTVPYSCCRLVSPANMPTLTSVSWLLLRDLLLQWFNIISADSLSSQTHTALTYSSCRLGIPANNPRLTSVSWLLPRNLIHSIFVSAIATAAWHNPTHSCVRLISPWRSPMSTPVSRLRSRSLRRFLRQPSKAHTHTHTHTQYSTLTAPADWSVRQIVHRSMRSADCFPDTCCKSRATAPLASLSQRASLLSLTDFADSPVL
jgi:hypothetical protein